MAIRNQTRLFIGNLPPDIQENELGKEFDYYGSVEKVEVKQKKSPDSNEVQNTFAFITISIDDRKLQQCLHEFKEQKFRDRFLQVTVARENFLEKLKREREEAAQQSSKRNDDQSKCSEDDAVKVELPTISKDVSSSSDSSSSDDSSSEDESAKKPTIIKGKTNGLKSRKSSSESSDSSDSESEQDPDNIVLKKKSKKFLENGRIKIDRNVSGGEAIHIIDARANKGTKKELDEKSKRADQKRMESMNKMKNSYNEQKLAIKKALAGVDASKKSNKIVFDDDGAEAAPSKTASQPAKLQTSQNNNNLATKKPSLFDDDEESSEDEKDYSENFEIKEQFEGKKGERLMKLQSRFQSDSRFKMDAKFADEDHEYYNETQKSKVNESSAETNDTAEDDERRWQYNILESVIGKKVHHEPSKKKAPPSMLRFDPTRAEHTKFIEPKGKKRPKTKNTDEPASKRSKVQPDEQMEEETDEIPVSMEHFHEVRGDLKKSLGSGGFSLLSMFNRPSDNDQNDGTKSTNEKPYEEKLIAKNSVKFLADFDPFKYDSSGDEADDGKNKKSNETTSRNSEKENGLQHESFFILNSTDARLSEGISLFTPPDSSKDEENVDGYDDSQRQELKNIVKRKIKKSIQNALPKHAKPNKRFRRFAKNL